MMTGIESLGKKLFTGGVLTRQVDGLEMAGWGISAVSPNNCPVTCDLHYAGFSGATSCSNNTAELTGFAEKLEWNDFFTPRGERARILHDSKHAARVTLGVAQAKRNIALAHKSNDLFFAVEVQISHLG